MGASHLVKTKRTLTDEWPTDPKNVIFSQILCCKKFTERCKPRVGFGKTGGNSGPYFQTDLETVRKSCSGSAPDDRHPEAAVRPCALLLPDARHGAPGSNCIKIGLSGKLILSKRKGLLEVKFS